MMTKELGIVDMEAEFTAIRILKIQLLRMQHKTQQINLEPLL